MELPGLVEARLVALLDPVVELVRGALPYSDAPASLPDAQAIPTLRVRRRVDAPGLRIVIDRHRDDERVASDDVQIDRLPLDRGLAVPRRRTNPAATTVLQLTSTAPTGHLDDHEPTGASTEGAAAGPTSRPGVRGTDGRDVDGDQHLVLPASGPGPQDVQAVLEAARRHRLVVLASPVTGDPALLAGLLLQVVAAGTACWCSAETAARLELLAPELRGALTFDLEPVLGDDLLLASRIAVQKRAAWADHDLRLGWEPDAAGMWAPRLRTVPWPAVGVVLVSRRPSAIPVALDMIAAQRHVELEVVVALHGGGDATEVDAQLGRLGLHGRVMSVPGEVPFGAVLNHAIARTTAPVVLKWDDDDLYGPRHVQDLLIARRQTGAALIGKSAEFVYFDGAGQSVWRKPGRAEAESIGMAGGTFLTDRSVLDEVGGYPDVARAVDHHLKVRLRERGLTTFRTHGFGFVLRRHAHGHTWDATDDQLRQDALRTFDGLPEILQLGDAGRHGTLSTP